MTNAPAKKKAVTKKKATKKYPRQRRRKSATRADIAHHLNLAALDAAKNIEKSIRTDIVPEKEQIALWEMALSRVVPKLKHSEIAGEVKVSEEIVIDFQI